MVITESLKISFEVIKKRENIAYALIAGLGYMVLNMIAPIPILGAFLYSYLFPRLTAWFYRKVGININPNYNIAFKALLIPSIIGHIGIILAIMMFGISILYNILFGRATRVSFINIFDISLSAGLLFIAILIVATIVNILLLYTIYGSILGKVNQLKIEAGKSLHLFALTIVIGAISLVITILLSIIPFIGWILIIIFNLIIATYTHLALGTLANKI